METNRQTSLTGLKVPSLLHVPEQIKKWAEDDGGAPFICEVNGPSLSAGEFDLASDRWALRFSRLGMREGDTVISALPPSIEAYAAWIGLARAGGIEVPVNPDLVGQFLRRVVVNSGARVAVATPDFLLELLAQMREEEEPWTIVVIGEPQQVPASIHRVLSLAAVDALKEESVRESRRPTRASDVSCILYTSGTTGPAKGVIVPWAQQLSVAEGVLAALGDIGSPPAYYSPFPVNHIGGKFPFVAMLVRRGRLVVKSRFRTQDLWNDVRKYECTTTLLLGAMAKFIESCPADPMDADNPLLRILQMPVLDNVEAFEARFALEVATVYNMTELGCPIVAQRRDGVGPKSCGKVREGFEARIVDEDDVEVPSGGVGELVIRARDPWTQTAGYWREPELTVRAFRNLWFHTGDAFTRDAGGNFYLVDRLKDTIRRRGENISSVEVERIIQMHENVAVVAVIGVPSPWGEKDIAAFIVPKGLVTAEDIWRHCADHMPLFMVPRYVTFVEAIPTTPTGKLRKVELANSPVTRDREEQRSQKGTAISKTQEGPKG